MTDMCACGHHSHVHTSDITGNGNSPCWESLDGRSDDHGYPVNRCPCDEYQPLLLGTITIAGTTYGPGAWLYLDGQPVTILGVEPDGEVWYGEGHLEGAGFAAPDRFTTAPAPAVTDSGVN